VRRFFIKQTNKLKARIAKINTALHSAIMIMAKKLECRTSDVHIQNAESSSRKLGSVRGATPTRIIGKLVPGIYARILWLRQLGQKEVRELLLEKYRCCTKPIVLM